MKLPMQGSQQGKSSIKLDSPQRGHSEQRTVLNRRQFGQ